MDLSLCVAQAWRGLGMGRRLLQLLLLGAATRRIAMVQAQVPEGDLPLVGLLRRSGMERVASTDPSRQDGLLLLRGPVPPLSHCLRHLRRPRMRERMRLTGRLKGAWAQSTQEA